MAFSIVATAAHHKWELLAVVAVTYIASICIYRRFFHPLAKIPGPFLPAVTKLYQSAYNRRYYEQIGRLHEKYGPVVRITPDEIHLSDPENYEKIYYMGTKYSKSPNYYNATCVPESTFGTPPNEMHRIRRGAMNPMFSRKMVLDLEAVVQDKAQKVCKRMQEGLRKSIPVDLHHAFRAVSVDVISDFAFDKSLSLLDRADLGAHFFALARGVGPAMWVFQQLPSFQALALKIPPWLAPYLSEPLGQVTKMQQQCIRQVEDVKARMAEGKLAERPTIFSTLLSEEDKPDGYRIPPTDHLKDEAYSVLMAAADTTGNAMTVAAFNVLYNPTIYQKLVQELADAFPDIDAEMPFVELEKMQYLSAVIKEALRLSFGVIGRLPRIVPDGGATFNDYYIPAGYIVGMSSWMMHRNPEVFPDPMTFDPERWLDPSTYREREHHLVAFGKGTRQCVGMPLAYCELYVTLGTFFRRFPGLKVFETTPEDMDYDDFFSSYHVNGKRWFKAIGKVSEEN